MKKEIIVNRSKEETRVAILEDGNLSDLFIERRESEKIVGNIYKGKVANILPGISSAFADVGLDKNSYLFVDDVMSDTKERKIEKMITRGQELMLQVYKEPIGTKGTKVTMDISLPGRLLVYMPFNDNIGISKHIESHQERDRLKKLIREMKPQDGGIIVRTEAEDATEKELKREIKYLQRLWDSIKERAAKTSAPVLLHKDLGLVFQTVRDYLNEEVDIVMIDNAKEYRDVVDFMKIVSPELLDKVKHFSGKTPIFKAFQIEEGIKKLRSNRVPLPSGGSIIIQEAESLCAIDVNTGSFTGRKSQEETVTITNIEAAKEIAKQLRLRNIGGIIVIDFIDMKKEKNRQKILSEFSHAVKGDKAKIKMWPITKLGLIEMTRERKRESLSSLMGEPCPACGGSGLVLSKESLYIHISNELEQMKLARHSGKVILKLNPAVAGYFKERVSRLTQNIDQKVEIHHSHEIEWEDYQIKVE
jgi:ribonuclease G